MKLNTILKAVLALAITFLLAPTAKAQFVGAANDLILSFTDQNASDQGYQVNYEVDLGSYSTYVSAGGTVNVTNLNSALTSIYGANWYSNTNLKFGIVGANNSGATLNGIKDGSIFASNTGALYTATSGSNLSGGVSAIAGLYNPAADGTNPPTNGPGLNAYTVPQANLYGFDDTTGALNLGARLTAAFNGTSDPTLKIDILQPGSSQFNTGTSTFMPGTFSISSTGQLSFTAAAVPEPSTYGLMILSGALLAFYQIRRKSAQA